MRILAFDTSTSWCSVAAGEGSASSERHEAVGQGHSERLLRMIDEVLAERGWARSDIEAIAFGAGPDRSLAFASRPVSRRASRGPRSTGARHLHAGCRGA
jgi:hypothetical protein